MSRSHRDAVPDETSRSQLEEIPMTKAEMQRRINAIGRILPFSNVPEVRA